MWYMLQCDSLCSGSAKGYTETLCIGVAMRDWYLTFCIMVVDIDLIKLKSKKCKDEIHL